MNRRRTGAAPSRNPNIRPTRPQNRGVPPPPVATPSAPPLNEMLVQEAILDENVGQECDQTVQSERRQDTPPPSYSECVNIELLNL